MFLYKKNLLKLDDLMARPKIPEHRKKKQITFMAKPEVWRMLDNFKELDSDFNQSEYLNTLITDGMKHTKGDFIKLEPHENVIRAGAPNSGEYKVFYKDQELRNVTKIVTTNLGDD